MSTTCCLEDGEHPCLASTRVRDGEESHRLQDILPLPVAVNGETEEREREEMESERISLAT
jgi:hypothetical protein